MNNENNDADKDVVAGNVLVEFEKFDQDVLQKREADRSSIALNDGNLVSWANKLKQLFPPFTYAGNKRDIARKVWQCFGADVPNYIEPFAGSLAVLLARPVTDLSKLKKYRELASDANLLLLNFWRAVQKDESQVLSQRASVPGHEFELLIRQRYINKHEHGLTLEKELQDEDYFDPKLAALWLYVTREWIGGKADVGSGFHQMKVPQAKEVAIAGDSLEDDLRYLKIRTRHVRFVMGGWKRVVKSETQTLGLGTTAVFLDPPYLNTNMYGGTFDGEVSTGSVNNTAIEAREWAINKIKDQVAGKLNNEKGIFRIAYCGYFHQHYERFSGCEEHWLAMPWGLKRGFSVQNKNPGSKPLEVDTIWFSPGCIEPEDKDELQELCDELKDFYQREQASEKDKLK